MGLLKTENLSFSVNSHNILDDISIDIWKGYVHAVVGPNGAGKSTFSSSIMGLDGYRNIKGKIYLDGEEINGLGVDQRAKRGITLAWQEPARFEGLTVKKYIESGAAEGHTNKDTRENLDAMGLNPSHYANRSADKTLSGGERKKVELASILAMKPRLVLLDEPDSGIDVESLGRIKNAITNLKENGTTVVLITHSMEVLSWAEHAFLMCCGKIVDKGKTEDITRYFQGKCIPCDHKNRPNLDGDLLDE
jgi:Fe-S cluster assembly ATP-binding protein